MSVVIVQTDDGREVNRFEVPDVYPGNMLWRNMLGRLDEPLGWLGRALRDARIIQQGGDPERPSEKAMRLADHKFSCDVRLYGPEATCNCRA